MTTPATPALLTLVERLARPELLAMKAYASARSLVDNAQRLTFLDANESPFAASDPPLNRYPEPQPRALRERFAQLYGVGQDQLLIGRGSDEAIEVLVRAFCRAECDAVLICPPTYGVYEIASQLQGAQLIKVPLHADASLDEPAILAAIEQHTADHSLPRLKLVFVCSPNNPTGTRYPQEQLRRLCQAAEGRCLLVVDEAYGEFSDEASMATLLAEFQNLVVLRTFSKAWALAGARCGVALGSPAVIALLQKVRAPYPLSSPAIAAIAAGTDDQAQARMIQRVQLLGQLRDSLRAELEHLSIVQEVFASSANFLLVRFSDSATSAAVMAATRSAGLILRDRSSEPGLQGCIRISIGTEESNRQLLAVLSEVQP
jgi:histidinol-phosphate aminotransferase